MKKVLFFCLFLSLISCSPALYNVSTTRDVPAGLLYNKEVLVLTPVDGISRESIAIGSGLKLASKVYYYLNAKQCEVTLDNEHKSINKVDDSELKKFDYIIVPTIANWEDNATAWSGKPDKIMFSLDIYDKNKNKITTANIDAKSTNATLAENDPSELIDKPLIEFINKLF